MPVLYILAGPNGTGKTTFYSIASQNNFIKQDLPFINVDIIAQSLGGYNEENYARALEVYRDSIKEFIDSGKDFMIESNLADSRSYDWVSLIKKNGYDIVLYYLSTDDVLINIGRVKRRVAEGGHDIAEAIIKSRYSQSHSYLKSKLFEFNEAYLIDNSDDISDVQVKIVNGVIIYKSLQLREWVKDVITLVEKVMNKNKEK